MPLWLTSVMLWTRQFTQCGPSLGFFGPHMPWLLTEAFTWHHFTNALLPKTSLWRQLFGIMSRHYSPILTVCGGWITVLHYLNSAGQTRHFQCPNVHPRGVGYKPISSVPLFSDFFSIVKPHVSYWISRLYLAGVAAAQLRWHLSNMDVIQRI